MVEDHEQILNEVLVSSQASDVTVPDEEDVVVIYDNEAVPILTAKAATQALLDLESFFQAQGKPADAEWCSARLRGQKGGRRAPEAVNDHPVLRQELV